MVRLGQVITIVKEMLAECEAETRGRPAQPRVGAPATYSDGLIVLILVLKTLKHWSIRHTYRKLVDEIDSTWRDLLGLEPDEVPSRRTLQERQHSRYVKRLRQQVWRRVRRHLLAQVDLSTLVVDLTAIEVNPEWDSHAEWGYTSDEEAFYGYKLHLICTADGLPLAIRLTRANGHETSEVCPLFQEAAALLGEQAELVEYVLGDAGYDATTVYEEAHAQLEAQFQADVNPRNAEVSAQDLKAMSDQTIEKVATDPARQQGLRTRYSEEGRQRHAQRTMVEELFGIGKEFFPGFADLQWFQAGIRRVREHFRWVLCAFTLVLLRNLRHDEPFLALKMVLH